MAYRDASTAPTIGLRAGLVLVATLWGALVVLSLRRGIGDWEAKKQRTSMVSAKALQTVSREWRLANSECPTMEILVQAKYVDVAAKRTDPWGGPYVISCEDDDVEVRSPGPDGLLGTADDIVTR